jgi:hypothetical protein
VEGRGEDLPIFPVELRAELPGLPQGVPQIGDGMGPFVVREEGQNLEHGTDLCEGGTSESTFAKIDCRYFRDRNLSDLSDLSLLACQYES